jgi:cytidine deaminase
VSDSERRNTGRPESEPENSGRQKGGGQSARWPEVERRTEPERRATPDRRKPHPQNGERAGRYNPADRRRSGRRSGKERRDEDAWESVPLEAPVADQAGGEAALVAAAADARTRAHAQYSGFKVGAALETPDGDVVTGCNVENATYGLTLCAERVALVKALSEGCEIFTRIAVVADTPDPTPPCGACRQLLWEYCGDIEVVLANLSGTTARLRLSALLPMPFDSRLLE